MLSKKICIFTVTTEVDLRVTYRQALEEKALLKLLNRVNKKKTFSPVKFPALLAMVDFFFSNLSMKRK